MSDGGFPALTMYRLGKLVTASLDLDSTLKAIVDAVGERVTVGAGVVGRAFIVRWQR